ncbi:diguanylate cyclase domain-containing protein [Musicola keenii]|uniref:diguanylate cyclase domain-containing protein n=1 Tax=Musicola keenii TaxID=2884250 RepID=UPI0017869C7C|nr:diguanylate cyclase [Musicola keenii]
MNIVNSSEPNTPHCAGNATFRQALTRINMLVVIITMVVSWMLITAASLFSFKQYADKNLQLLAYTLSRNVEAAVVFRDGTAANEMLASLGQQEQFRRAVLSDAKGNVLTNWRAAEQEEPGWFSLFTSRWLFRGSVKQPIYHRGQLVGYLEIAGTDTTIRQFVSFSLLSLTLCILLASILAIFISHRLHRGLIQALHNIAEVVHDIRNNRHFSRRIPKVKIAELDSFGHDLNSLLDEIESWQQQMRKENDSLLERSLRDPLTGLANRTAFLGALGNILADRHHQTSAALLFMDGNSFKHINDTYGHAAGDQVLIAVANRLARYSRKQDLAARLGGDEFALILADIHDVSDVERVADSIRQAMQEPIPLDESLNVSISLSIGIAMTEPEMTPEALMAQADKAMYLDKQCFRLATTRMRRLSESVL